MSLFTGKPVLWLPTCESTNKHAALEVKNNNTAEGYVVATYNQTAGRGQAGNVWHANPNENLTFSVVYEPVFLHAGQQFYLNMAVCLALANFLKNKGVTAKIKWPNDIYICADKIAGILIENMLRGSNISHSVIGIGLNINQTDFPTGINATSLKLQTGNEETLEPLLDEFLSYLEQEYLLLKALHFTDMYDRYTANLLYYRQQHLYTAEGQKFYGTIMGVNPQGKLVMDTNDGEKEFGFKEVVFHS